MPDNTETDELHATLRELMRNCSIDRDDLTPEWRERMRARRDELIGLQAGVDQRTAAVLGDHAGAWQLEADFDAMDPAKRAQYFENLKSDQILSEAIRWLNWLLGEGTSA